MALVFDLRHSLSKQLAHAKQLLNAHAAYERRHGLKRAPKVQRAGRADYCTLLRVLDARASGASYSAIAKVLFPTRTTESARDLVKKLASEAERLRDGRYRDLSTLSDPPKVGNVKTPA